MQDLTGTRYGRLTVTGLAVFSRDPQKRRWTCLCDCGTQKSFIETNIKYGATKSCGCLSKEMAAKTHTKHGLSGKSKAYHIWLGIINRCHNKNDMHYERYGGRGILVCARWRRDVRNFISDMGEPPPGTSIDRIDNDRGYSPENCRWATMVEQQNNRSSNRRVTCNGKTQTISEWSREIGVKKVTIQQRLANGWSDEDAVTIPVGKRSRWKK